MPEPQQAPQAGVIPGQPYQHGVTAMYIKVGETRFRNFLHLGTHEECQAKVRELLNDPEVKGVLPPQCLWLYLN